MMNRRYRYTEIFKSFSKFKPLGFVNRDGEGLRGSLMTGLSVSVSFFIQKGKSPDKYFVYSADKTDLLIGVLNRFSYRTNDGFEQEFYKGIITVVQHDYCIAIFKLAYKFLSDSEYVIVGDKELDFLDNYITNPIEEKGVANE